VLISTDPDREGEAIAWHLTQVLKLNGSTDDHAKRYARIEFHEITRTAIEEAIAHPRKINLALVNAQQARRILDRIVGYKLSPFLWRKVAKGLSAGRVQSVAVRFVVDRERAIEAFNPQEYWEIVGLLKNTARRPKKEFSAKLTKIGETALNNSAIKNLPYELPNGWKWVRLGEVCEVCQYGLTATATDKGDFPFIRITDIDDLGNIKMDGIRFINCDENTYKKYAVKEEDILFARSGSIGRSFLYRGNSTESNFCFLSH